MSGARYAVVDASGEKTGALVTRDEAAARGLGLQYAQVYVFNRRGELLVAQRGPAKTRDANLLDASAAGHVELGQDFDACASAELSEELGVTAVPEFVLEWTGYWGVARLYRVVHEGPFVLEDGVARVQFYPLEELRTLMEKFPYLLSDGFRSGLENYLKWRENND